MKRIIIAVLMFIPLSSCCIPGTDDYVYTTGSYGYSPYAGTYPTGWGSVGYWRGYRAVSTRGLLVTNI